MPTTTPNPAAVLRDAGLRVTAARLATLRALTDTPHTAADAIAETVRGDLGTVSTQAVYDVLRALTTADLVRRIEPAGSAALYETRTGDNHHHLVCRSCGAVADVDCAVGEVPCLEPSQPQGFEVDEAEVVYWGTCAPCQAATPRTEADPEVPTPQEPTS
ncbi:MAG: Fur family transcriptional regulator [Iamia sp.]